MTYVRDHVPHLLDPLQGCDKHVTYGIRYSHYIGTLNPVSGSAR